jgi:hypothetical protein
MLELFDTNPDANVAPAEYQRLLGFPRGHELEGRSRELADWARDWFGKHGKPWIYARESDALQLTAGRLNLGGTEFSSQQLHDQFETAQAHQAVLVAVSAGKECEEKARELWQDGKPDEYFFMEVFGSAVVEHLITIASGRICGWADSHGMVALPHYSPGYSGWDVSDQHKLWSLLRPQTGHALPEPERLLSPSLSSIPNGGEGGRRPGEEGLCVPGFKAQKFISGNSLPGELHVMDTGMLRPKKSLLAVIGITANVEQARRFARLVPCENCSLPACQYRRVPYKHSLPQIEDVRRLQGGLGNDLNGSIVRPSQPPPQYSVNARALRKWSQERLWLNTAADGRVEARFRYEGTTCSSMGRPLAYDYHVRLQPPGEDYRIVAATCAPASDDTGHASQCAYLNDSAELQRNIERDVPLLGQPLHEVFAWERSPNPAGCYCESSARLHKWGLVFEVIHFALTEQQKTGSSQFSTE